MPRPNSAVLCVRVYINVYRIIIQKQNNRIIISQRKKTNPPIKNYDVLKQLKKEKKQNNYIVLVLQTSIYTYQLVIAFCDQSSNYTSSYQNSNKLQNVITKYILAEQQTTFCDLQENQNNSFKVFQFKITEGQFQQFRVKLDKQIVCCLKFKQFVVVKFNNYQYNQQMFATDVFPVKNKQRTILFKQHQSKKPTYSNTRTVLFSSKLQVGSFPFVLSCLICVLATYYISQPPLQAKLIRNIVLKIILTEDQGIPLEQQTP
eukprot:TRINITY_DN3086_c0_g2_i8.p1 TRINITY_DN3086_c0_g2~~TRINITY_DN3086_c0_g2_i8.p1  ORF type:complete len:260 (-),score=-15.84 TRINITY_DN3086_c0_g2_i8:271-1050(-)